MNLKLTIESLSMDLLRAALGRYSGSISMAAKFEKEALLRNQEVYLAAPKNPYLKTLITKTYQLLKSNSAKKADDLLMYSVLFKNLIQSQQPLY